MRAATFGKVALVAGLLVVPLVAGDDATVVERRIERLVASPFPLAGLSAGSDEAVYRVDARVGTVVQVSANATPSSVFVLHARPWEGGGDLASPVPSSRQSLLLPPGAWQVEVDPFAGAAVDIDVLFRGFANDVGGAPTPFGFTDVRVDDGCFLSSPEVCLP